MFEILNLHHASFLISDLERARDFYHRILAMPLLERPDLGYPGLWLQLGPRQQLHLMQLPNPDAGSARPPHGGRDRHIALQVRNLAELESRLRAAEIDYTLSRSGRRALFCRDPDDNVLEFVELETE